MVCSSRVFPSNLLENLFTESIKYGLASITTPDGVSSLLMDLNHPFNSILDIGTFVRSHFKNRGVNVQL